MVSLLICVIVFAIIFDYINGFHDAANAIATVVSTGVLPVRTAVFIAGILNFLSLQVSIYKISYCSVDASQQNVFAFVSSSSDKIDSFDSKTTEFGSTSSSDAEEEGSLVCYAFLAAERARRFPPLGYAAQNHDPIALAA